MSTFESSLFDVFEEAEPPKRKKAKGTDDDNTKEATILKEQQGDPIEALEVERDFENDDDELQEAEQEQK